MACGVDITGVLCALCEMKSKDKEKVKMAANKVYNLTPSESMSRREVEAQDNSCRQVLVRM